MYWTEHWTANASPSTASSGFSRLVSVPNTRIPASDKDLQTDVRSELHTSADFNRSVEWKAAPRKTRGWVRGSNVIELNVIELNVIELRKLHEPCTRFANCTSWVRG